MLSLLVSFNALPAQKTTTRLTQSDTTTEAQSDTCQTFCDTNTESWNTKCAWGSNACSGCDSCSHANVTDCQNWCGDNTESWYNKCKWSSGKCSSCDECGMALTGGCESWCEGHTRPWTTKCAWPEEAGCSGCQDCALTPHAPPASPPPPATVSLAVKTCDVSWGGSDGQLYYKTSQGSAVQLDNAGDDRVRGATDTYTVTAATLAPFTLEEASTDGWCVEGITYNGKEIDMSACGEGKVWLDSPCPSTNVDGVPCQQTLTVDPILGAVTDCSVALTFSTCDVSYGGSDHSFTYKTAGTDSYSLENDGDDRVKGGSDTYFVPAATNEFSVSADSTDGWCIDKITYAAKDIDLSDCEGGYLWLDNPCNTPAGSECLTSMTVSIADLKVTNC